MHSHTTILVLVALLTGGCKTKDDSPVIQPPDAEAFARILKEHRVVLVDFTASWCAPCKTMKPVIRGLAKDYQGKAAVVEIDVDRERELASAHGASAVPLFVVFRDGKAQEAISGVVPRIQLVHALEKQLRADR